MPHFEQRGAAGRAEGAPALAGGSAGRADGVVGGAVSGHPKPATRGHPKPATPGHLKTSHQTEGVCRVEWSPKGAFCDGEPDRHGQESPESPLGQQVGSLLVCRRRCSRLGVVFTRGHHGRVDALDGVHVPRLRPPLPPSACVASFSSLFFFLRDDLTVSRPAAMEKHSQSPTCTPLVYMTAGTSIP